METKKNQKLEVKQRYEINFENENQYVVINGVVINKKIIGHLDYIQGSSISNEKCVFYNEGYKEYAVSIAEILAYLSFSAEYTRENETVIENSKHLSFILQMIKEFSFPKELISNREFFNQ